MVLFPICLRFVQRSTYADDTRNTSMDGILAGTKMSAMFTEWLDMSVAVCRVVWVVMRHGAGSIGPGGTGWTGPPTAADASGRGRQPLTQRRARIFASRYRDFNSSVANQSRLPAAERMSSQ